MKRLLCVFLVLLLVLSFSACGQKTTVSADYNDAASFETDLNNGDDLVGKIVKFECREFEPSSTFGYNIIAGEHLNFCSSENPNVKKGDVVTVKVTKIESFLGSWIISYEMVE